MTTDVPASVGFCLRLSGAEQGNLAGRGATSSLELSEPDEA
jgi:hypothetical protein